MNEREFYDLCYDQYKAEMAEAEGLYHRAGVLLAALPVLGAVAYGLGRVDLLARLLERVDIFLFHCAMATAFAALGVGVYYLIRCVYPRSDYQTLASMEKWQNWRVEFREWLAKKGEADDQDTKTGAEMLRALIPLVAVAQEKNATLNEKRRKQFQKSVRAAAVAIVAIGIQGLFRLILHLQGI
ncbi:MAG: hypothetical protein R6X20_07330 [Phycisphaerae bacterium]